VLGPDQRIPVIEAIRAATINGAYQLFEEETKGSIEVGKLADLVVLSENPLQVDPMTIKDIQVLETIKEGKTIFEL
jgi:predicted amidohydrolase YtcJ